jgi:hypothetical protein
MCTPKMHLKKCAMKNSPFSKETTTFIWRFCFWFFVELGFELRTLCLQTRQSEATHPVQFGGFSKSVLNHKNYFIRLTSVFLFLTRMTTIVLNTSKDMFEFKTLKNVLSSMVALACTLIMKEAETERTGVPGQPGLH